MIIQSKQSTIKKIRVYNSLGRIIYSKNPNNVSELKIEAKKFSNNSVYLFYIQTEAGSYVKKHMIR